MDSFNYKNNELYAEDLAVTDLADQYGSPLYIYSKATLVRHMNAFKEALAKETFNLLRGKSQQFFVDFSLNGVFRCRI